MQSSALFASADQLQELLSLQALLFDCAADAAAVLLFLPIYAAAAAAVLLFLLDYAAAAAAAVLLFLLDYDAAAAAVSLFLLPLYIHLDDVQLREVHARHADHSISFRHASCLGVLGWHGPRADGESLGFWRC